MIGKLVGGALAGLGIVLLGMGYPLSVDPIFTAVGALLVVAAGCLYDILRPGRRKLRRRMATRLDKEQGSGRRTG